MSNKMGKNEDLTLLSIIIVFALIFSTYTMIKAMNEAHKEANEMMKQGVYSNNSYYMDDYDSSYRKAENENNYEREYATNNSDDEWLINEIAQIDFINDIRKTYHEVQNRHGDIVYTDYYSGGRYFEFQDDPDIDYFFTLAGDFDSNPPADDAVCITIVTSANKILGGLGNGMDIDVFAQNIGNALRIQDNVDNGEDDCARMVWFAVENAGVTVTIDMRDPDMISPTDRIWVQSYYQDEE